VIVSVINDLASDQRVQRSCSVLKECGYEILLIGRRLKNSPSVDHLPFRSKRMNLIFTSGPLFYFFYNLRLFFALFFSKTDLLFSNDLDTLWANYLISKLKGLPLIYDSHEIFCEVPELQKNPFKKRIWEYLEKRIVPQLQYCVTVNQSIANYFQKKYAVNFTVIRNIPSATGNFKPKSRQELNLDPNKKIIIYQGAGINIDRGAEELVEAMQYVNNAQLLIIGSGDVFPKLKQMITELKLQEKILIINKLPKSELLNYTYNSDLGISIDKDSNLNYHFSLPNKIFDYIQAGVPILASRLPEIESIIKKYGIGGFIDNHSPHHIAEKINQSLTSPQLSEWKNNSKKAAMENSWDLEKAKLAELIGNLK
jgi:glycosyltransferase involved in cell wall biosynthesis